MLKQNILLALFLSVLTDLACGQVIPKPRSQFDDGFASHLLYLKRAEMSDHFGVPFTSHMAKGGHWYYPVKIGDDTFNLEISSWSTKTAVIGKECGLVCDVPKKYDHGSYPYRGQTTLASWKDFQLQSDWTNGQNAAGFKQVPYTGRYIEEDVEITDYANKKLNVTDHLTYVVFDTMGPTGIHKSNNSGYLGLGPYTWSQGTERAYSIMNKLKTGGEITKNIVTYNITFFGENDQIGTDSYVQLGDLSKYVQRNLTWVAASGWDYFTSPVAQSYIMTGPTKIYPFIEFNTSATFDPEVDYMYVNQLEFTTFITPIFKEIYGTDNKTGIYCNQEECHFEQSCDQVNIQDAKINFAISTDTTHYYQITLPFEEYLIDSRTQWGTEEAKCYIPIFINNPGTDLNVFSTWFLGNMFLDRYMVVHNMEGADDIGGKYKPRIGVYDKALNYESEPAFYSAKKQARQERQLAQPKFLQ